MFKSDESFTCPSFETTFKTKLIRATSINFRARHLLIAFSEQVALLLRRSIEWYEMVDGNKENVTMLCKILRWNNVELNNVQNAWCNRLHLKRNIWANVCNFLIFSSILFARYIFHKVRFQVRKKDLLSWVQVVVENFNLEISRCYSANCVKELH